MAGPTPERVLIVDDDPAVIRALERVLRADFDIVSSGTAEEGLGELARNPCSVVLMDLSMPGIGGIEGLRRAKLRHPDIEVIVMTGAGTVEAAVECMKEGAFDFLTKPFESHDLVIMAVRRALERRALVARTEQLLEQLDGQFGFGAIVAESTQMRAVLDAAEAVARRDSPVLLLGESGTGKELIARSIYLASPRRHERFVTVNCGALPREVIESELFGHEKGAFTGAVAATIGLFREADHGTIFLDEVGELPTDLQVRLLRTLQDGEVRPVGGSKPVHVDVRIVAATNRDLEAAVARGRFRSDLYYRLAVVTLRVPALRERRADVAPLARHFVRVHNEATPRFEGIEPDALDAIERYSWPGNVRELENAIEHAFALGKGKRLGLQDLPPAIRQGGGTAPRDEIGVPLTLAAYERLALERALRQTHGNADAAAEALGISRATFYRKARAAGLELRRYKR